MKRFGTSFLLLAAAAPLALATAAQAQDATSSATSPDAPQAAADADEAITVTGSRLPSTDLTGPAPLTILDRSEIEATGSTSIGELVRELPVASASASDTAGRGNDGSANVALRGLSAVNTLVLVNGRRMLSNSSAGTVDLNSVPFEAVDRVEVLQDGASAVYGADAVAGVVNIILRRDYDGLLLKGGYGISSRGDLPNRELSGTFGRKFDNGGFVFNASYRQTGGNLIGDRPISRDPDWRSLGGRNFRDSAPTTGTAFKGLDPTRPGTIMILKDGVAQGNTLGDYRDAYFPGVFTDVNGTQNDGINYWQYESSASEVKQFNTTFAGEYELGSRIKAFVESGFSHRTSLGFLAPDYFDGTITVSAANRFNPFGRDLVAYRTLVEEGLGAGRRSAVESNLYRIVAGLEGELGTTWHWDASANIQHLNQYTDSGKGVVTSRLQRAVGPDAACAAYAGCIPINLFAGVGSITAAQLDSVSAQHFRDVTADLHSFVANISGTVLPLWAGDLNVALGAEYREEGFKQVQDNAPDYPTQTPPFLPPTRKVSEIYAEVGLPLLKDVPFAYRLDIEAAGRYSHYNAFGDTWNPKVGVKWRPYSDLLIRGSWGTAFRAPTFGEANSTQSRGYRPVTDPCATAQYAALPGCHGIQAPVTTGTFVVTGGNPNLQPETAKTLTVGAVFTPSFVPRLSLTVDYYHIKKSNIIGIADVDYIIAQNAAGLDYAGRVTRNPDGSIYEMFATRDNLLDQSIKGLDFGLEYTTASGPWGKLNARIDATYMSSYTLSPAPNQPAVERIGTYTTAIGTLPRWKGNARLTWSLDDLTVSYGVRYVGGVRNDASLLVNGVHLTADDYMQHDISVNYDFAAAKAKLTLGVENIGDAMPPFLEGNYANGFDNLIFNSRGRFFYVRVQKGF
ncbi:TonB-dependent receptor [Sphingobium aquiterrae]|uniref:TonB-dependent receptor plug domain-containing protein n=1 Tax=Sphingobium aquiterrae TaxID=2038656 RepID=UPI00301ACDEF